MTPKRIGGFLILLGIAVLVFQLFGGFSKLQCSRAANFCALTQLSLKGIQTRKIALNEITQATIVSQRGSKNRRGSSRQRTRRMVIVTESGSLPFTRHFSGRGIGQKFSDQPHKATQQAEALNQFLAGDELSFELRDYHLIGNMGALFWLFVGGFALFGSRRRA